MELRKDYILDRFVLISENRGQRPYDFFQRPDTANGDTFCYFCPGNENTTPPTKGQIGDPWKIRWFQNKFAFLLPEGRFEITTDNKFYTYSDAFGYHEVIVETSDHQKQLSDLSDFEIKDLLRVYKDRIEELSSRPNIKYAMIFKNHGKNAGTSLKHSHTQIAALNHIPRLVSEKLSAIQNYSGCPYCEVLNIEKSSLRRCYENNSFVAFTPYASRFNYEIWIFPKKHYISMTQLDDWELLELAQVLKKVLLKLKELNASYNFYIHNSPQYYINNNQFKGMHFHIEICPRISTFGGLEVGAEVFVNTLSPENAAKFYRDEPL